MPNLMKLKLFMSKQKNIIKNILLLLCFPFCLIILNMLLNTLFNLGVYTGTFLRFLYSFVVY